MPSDGGRPLREHGTQPCRLTAFRKSTGGASPPWSYSDVLVQRGAVLTHLSISSASQAGVNVCRTHQFIVPHCRVWDT